MLDKIIMMFIGPLYILVRLIDELIVHPWQEGNFFYVVGVLSTIACLTFLVYFILQHLRWV